MKSVRFKKLDAFAANGSSGNPAGAVYLTDRNDLSPTEMQTIARELAGFVSEVGFLARLAPTEYWIRYYSSEREVAFCGHATIAIMYDLITTSPELLGVREVRISTSNARLTVENHVADADCVFVTAPRPRFGAWEHDTQELADALRLSARSLGTDRPVSRVNAGLETLIVPIQSLTEILSVAPELQSLKAFCVNHAIDILTLYAEEVSRPGNSYRTRVFAPTFGYLEDPATGSGNAAFGHYLLAYGLWDGAMMSLEQNDRRDRPNIVKLLARTNAQREKEVLFGGNAIVKIAGDYFVG